MQKVTPEAEVSVFGTGLENSLKETALRDEGDCDEDEEEDEEEGLLTTNMMD